MAFLTLAAWVCTTGTADQFSVGFKCVARKCSLCHYQHTFHAATLECCLRSVWVFPPSNLVAPGFLPEPRERWSPHTAAEVPSQGTGQAAWVGTWDPLQVVSLASVSKIFSLCSCWGLNHFSARKQASQCAPHSVLSYCWAGQISAWFSFKCSLQREGREGSHLY